MTIQPILRDKSELYNSVVSHPLQSFEWGEFRKKTGLSVIRQGIFEDKKLLSGFQLTIHPLPRLPFTIGYLPKSTQLPKIAFEELSKIGRKYNSIFIQLEPGIIYKKFLPQQEQVETYEDVKTQWNKLKKDFPIVPSAHPLFTKNTFALDITQSEKQLLSSFHPKTRYNIRVAQKHEVEIVQDNSDEAFQAYLDLTEETTKRQGFYAHSRTYHELMWETLKSTDTPFQNRLSARLLLAKHRKKIITAWMLFLFHDTLYYPYGASSREYKETMASNLVMWEAIKFGKKHGAKTFDLWGSLGTTPNASDPWYGFHRFKQGYNPMLIEFLGSYDLLVKPMLYQAYKIADKLRWTLLAFKKR